MVMVVMVTVEERTMMEEKEKWILTSVYPDEKDGF